MRIATVSLSAVRVRLECISAPRLLSEKDYPK